MAAELAIRLIDDGGPAPIGQPAPANVGQTTLPPAPPASSQPTIGAPSQDQRRDSAPRQQEASRDAITLGEGMSALARVGGFGAVVTATQMLQDAIRGIQAGPSTSAPSVKVGGQSGGGGGGQPVPPPVIEGAGAAAEVEGGSATAMAGEAAGAASIAGPVALAATALVGLGYAARGAAHGLEAEARDLSQFSDKLAESTARADLRRQETEIRRANELGDSLSDVQDSMSRIESSTSKITTVLEKSALELIGPILKTIADLLGQLVGEDPFAGDPFTERIMSNLVGYNGIDANALAAMNANRKAFVGAAQQAVDIGANGFIRLVPAAAAGIGGI